MLDITDEFEPGDWMRSVADVLSVTRSTHSFTLGEAVAELGLWANTARNDSWKNLGNRRTLFRDVKIAGEALGPRLRTHVSDLLQDLGEEANRQTVGETASLFATRWHQTESIRASFRDLCEVAIDRDSDIRNLKPKADILASQVGGSLGDGTLGTASFVLFGNISHSEITFWLDKETITDNPTPTNRLREAERLLTSNAEQGQITVWLLYRHGQVDRRITAGTVTLFDAEWALHEAKHTEDGIFEEQEELRSLQESQCWFNEEMLFDNNGSRESYALARVNLGYRPLEGSVDEAIHRVEALLSIVVGAGGSNWTYTGVCTARVDGRLQVNSVSANPRNDYHFYNATEGRKTYEILRLWTSKLDDALSISEMPELLVEALRTFREANIINRYDSSLPYEPVVTSKIATALEDHVIELIASLAGLTPEHLISALEARETDYLWQDLIFDSLLAPLSHNHNKPEILKEVESIKRDITRTDSSGTQHLVLKNIWKEQSRLRALPISLAVRNEFQYGLAVISSADLEMTSRDYVRQSITLIRMRHRRVRNAITHGNPLTSAAVNSVRAFSERMARTAIGFALDSFIAGETLAECLTTWEARQITDNRRLTSGESMLDRTKS